MHDQAKYLWTLSNHAVKRRLRQGSGLFLLLGLLSRGFLFALLISAAAAAGLHADLLVAVLEVDTTPTGAVQQYFLHALVVLYAFIVLSPLPSGLNLEPYRYLPVPRSTIAWIDVLMHTIRLPLILFAALGAGFVVGGALAAGGAPFEVSWLVLVAASGAAATIAGVATRRRLITQPRRYYVTVGALLAAIAADLSLSAGLLARASEMVLGALFDGALWPSLAALAAAALAFLSASRATNRQLRYIDFPGTKPPALALDASHQARQQGLQIERFVERCSALRVALIELRMLRRCAYPRYQIRGITVLLILLLVVQAISPDGYDRLVAVLFVVAGLSVTYAQLAFAWNSRHLDGLLALPIPCVDHIRARWLVGALMAGVSAACMLLFLLILGRPLLLELGAVLALTLGGLVPVLIWLSTLTARPVDLDASAVANLQSYTWHFYVLVFALWIGTQGAAALIGVTAVAATYLGLGMLGLLLLPSLVRYLAGVLDDHRPELAERLRTTT